MVRILLIVTVIGGLITGVFGFLINEKKVAAAQDAQQTHATLSSTQTQLSKTKEDLKSTSATLADTKTQLSDATTKAEAIQTSLTAAQDKVNDLQGKLDSATQEVNTAQAAAKAAQDQLGAASQEAKDAEAKAEDLDKQKRMVEDDLAAEKAEVARLKDMIERAKTGTVPPGINGKIVSVNRNWNFVVLNIGDKDGLVENAELNVARAGHPIGKIRVVSTEANTAVADIMVNTLQGQIQPGDDVLN